MSDNSKPSVPELHESETENEDTTGGPIIDPEVRNEVEETKPEDPFFTEYATGKSQDNEQVDVTKNWIGDESGDNWKPKTLISSEQIIAFSQVRMLGNAFEELEEIEPMLDKTVRNLEQYAVSRDGISRKEHVEVLKAMHSGEMGESSATDALANIFAAPKEDE